MKPTCLDHALTMISALALIGSGSFFVARHDVKLASAGAAIENGKILTEGTVWNDAPSHPLLAPQSERAGEGVSTKE